MTEEEFVLEDLKSRFNGINKKEYYLSYSGGKDSHFLYWFIKEYLKDNQIEIVSCNTYMEHKEMIHRMMKYSDTILIPKMKPFEIKESYGSPCFSKIQDDFIDRYQRGSRCDSILKRIYGEGDGNWTKFKLNNQARELLLSNKLHRISPKCCMYLKKQPFKEFNKQTNKHAILGVRGGESIMRNAKYKTCLHSNGNFTPIHDISNEMIDSIYKKYQIAIPKIYNHISRTGCVGCPYGSFKKETDIELNLVDDKKREFIVKYFNESYDVLGINYKIQQMILDI